MDMNGALLPFGMTERAPSASELDFFRRTGVPGYAASDDRVVMNPSPAEGVNYDAVRQNEAARIFMRQNQDYQPGFGLTDEQNQFLGKTGYAGAPDADRQATIAARIYSGDPSGGVPTPEQQQFVKRLQDASQGPSGLLAGSPGISPVMDMTQALQSAAVGKKSVADALLNQGPNYNTGILWPWKTRAGMDVDQLSTDYMQGDMRPAVPSIIADMYNSAIRGGQMIQNERGTDPGLAGMAMKGAEFFNEPDNNRQQGMREVLMQNMRRGMLGGVI